ncbi:MAG: hypothetical protein ACLFP8_03795 [Alphaproteobacteria bacterium]
MKNKILKPKSKKQNAVRANIAFFVFLSFAAILSVVILESIYLFYDSPGEPVDVYEIEHSEVGEHTRAGLEQRMKEEIRSVLPEDYNNVYYPEERLLYGRWYTRIGQSGIAEFTFLPDSYELIYVHHPRSLLREYSKGRFDYDPETGLLGLFPLRNAQPSLQHEKIRYKIMTMRKYQMLLLKHHDKPTLYMVANERDLAGKNYHPLFMYESLDAVPVLAFEPVNLDRK